MVMNLECPLDLSSFTKSLCPSAIQICSKPEMGQKDSQVSVLHAAHFGFDAWHHTWLLMLHMEQSLNTEL